MKAHYQGVHHLALVTRDMEKSLYFYRDILGFDLVERFFDEGENAEIVFLSLGNTLLELLAPEDPQAFQSPAGFHLALGVRAVDQVFALLQEKGIPVLLPLTESGGYRYAYFSGPMGEVVEIVERV
ncbi:MAG: VOC family protein [Candidatus Caldatribacteriaceae bacterium]